MAKTLKSTGLAADLVCCVAIDDDDTIKEFKASRGITESGTITKTTATWRSSGTVKTWVASANARLQFASAFSLDFNTGISVYAAVVKLTDDTSQFQTHQAIIGGDFAAGTGHSFLIGTRADTDKIAILASEGNQVFDSTNTIPYDNSTKWSLCATYKNNQTTTGYEFYSANESTADLSANGSGSSGNWYTSGDLWAVGNLKSGYNRPFQGELAIVAVFNRQLNQSEFDTLHDDPFGVLFESAATRAPSMSLLGVG